MKSTIICAFPGCAKSTVYRNAEKYGFYPMETNPGKDSKYPSSAFFKKQRPLFDSDSSLFDKSAFPENYIHHIECQIEKFDSQGLVMFVSSHDVVRANLAKKKIPYTLVYPKREIKDEWIKRYVKRGSPEAFIKLMTDNWDSFIDSCEQDKNAAKHIVLDVNDDITLAL